MEEVAQRTSRRNQDQSDKQDDKQKDKDKPMVRNDRIVAVLECSMDYAELKHIKEVNKNLLDELEHFFEYYNSMCGKKFKMLGVKGPKTALKLIKKHLRD